MSDENDELGGGLVVSIICLQYHALDLARPNIVGVFGELVDILGNTLGQSHSVVVVVLEIVRNFVSFCCLVSCGLNLIQVR